MIHPRTYKTLNLASVCVYDYIVKHEMLHALGKCLNFNLLTFFVFKAFNMSMSVQIAMIMSKFCLKILSQGIIMLLQRCPNTSLKVMANLMILNRLCTTKAMLLLQMRPSVAEVTLLLFTKEQEKQYQQIMSSLQSIFSKSKLDIVNFVLSYGCLK